MPKAKILLVSSHPIQYQVPWFRALSKESEYGISVLFVTIPDAQQQGVGFGVAFEWDIPLFEGYCWRQVQQLRGKGGLHGFYANRIVNPVELLRELKPDVLILTGWQSFALWQVLLSAAWLRIPLIMRAESNNLRQRTWYSRIIHRFIVSRCQAFLSIGKANTNFYKGYGVRPERIFNTSYYVDNNRFADAAKHEDAHRNQRRSEWNIPIGSVCFCYAGKLEPKKRILDLLEALKEVVVKLPADTVHLLVVGTGELMEEARQSTAEHNLPVSFAGFLNQSEIPAAYVVSDCLVLPSDYGETWGLVVNEAMACGRPAIVSDRVGCGPDLIEPGVTGEVFPFADTLALARIMIDMASDPMRLARMGVQARAKVFDGYTVSNAVKGTIDAVDYVLHSQG